VIWLLIGLGLLVCLGIAGFAGKRWMDMMQLRAEEKAQDRLNDERRRFIRRLDHELKNPLTAMNVSLANLAEADNPEDRRRISAHIKDQVSRLSHLVTDLRKLANLDERPIERLPVNIGSLLQQLIMSTQDHPEAQDRRLVMPSEQELSRLPVIVGDEDLLQLAVYNLMDNAIKFTDSGDKVELRVSATYDTVSIEVEDTGQGIPPEDLPYIWEELYRSKEVHGIPGSGLGLAIVKTIVELHDGEIDVSSHPGTGTTMTLTLPTE
jgi:two-component system OmpR family sensor kinase